MSIIACKTKGLPEENPLHKDALPKGFFYLVDAETEQIIEPVLYFLSHQFLFRKGKWCPNTVEAVAYDLADWWSFLEYVSKSWLDACLYDLVQYRNSMLEAVSPRTHRPYSTSTINRRLTYITQLYSWASKRCGYIGDISLEASPKASRSIDSQMLAHLGTVRLQPSTPTWLKVKRSAHDLPINPLSREEWHLVARTLGPLPSEQLDDFRPSRDRLAAELSLLTGLRVDEVAGLRAEELLKLPDNAGDPFGATSIVITRTKGSVPRKILIPNFFIPELKTYIHRERNQALSQFSNQTRDSLPTSLFLNHGHSNRLPGNDITAETLSRSFKKAVLMANLVKQVINTDPESSNHYITEVAKHSFHDLRHTFAIWLYRAEANAGNAEPWKTIQIRLGHAQLETTLNTYLKTAELERASFSSQVYAEIKRMTKG